MHSHTHSCCTDECVNTSVSLEIFLMTPQWHGYVTIHVDTRKKKTVHGELLNKMQSNLQSELFFSSSEDKCSPLISAHRSQVFFFFFYKKGLAINSM